MKIPPREVCLEPLDPRRCPLGCRLDSDRTGTCQAIDRDAEGVPVMASVRSCGGLGFALVCHRAHAAWITAGRPEVPADEFRAAWPLERVTAVPGPPPADALPPALSEAPASLEAWELLDPADAGAEPRAAQAQLKAFAEEVARDLARPAGERQAPWILLLGEPGTGKTLLLRILGRLAAAAGLSVRYTLFLDMVDDVKACRSPDSGWREETVLARYTEPDVLIIDDVKPIAKGDAGKTEEIAHTIIATRHGSDLGLVRRQTWSSSNLSMRQLLEVLSRPTLDRYLDGGLRPWICAWPSYRRREPRGPGRDFSNT